ncbi:MAG: hypothetical protein NBV67_09050 [Tagaea sp.]|nr:hypothetical protein [Tagaea sp.]
MSPPDDPIRNDPRPTVPRPSDDGPLTPEEIAFRRAAIDRFRARILALPDVDSRNWEEIRRDLNEIEHR